MQCVPVMTQQKQNTIIMLLAKHLHVLMLVMGKSMPLSVVVLANTPSLQSFLNLLESRMQRQKNN